MGFSEEKRNWQSSSVEFLFSTRILSLSAEHIYRQRKHWAANCQNDFQLSQIVAEASVLSYQNIVYLFVSAITYEKWVCKPLTASEDIKIRYLFKTSSLLLLSVRALACA